MNRLTLANVLLYLDNYMLDLQRWQITAESHPDYGGVLNPDYDMADPKITGNFVVACAYLSLGRKETNQELFKRVLIAADYLLKAQRPSGLIDLLSVNYDSGPDTAFTVQQICTIFELGRSLATTIPAWATLLQKLEQFVRRAVSGMVEGGFHTPNHRWVIVSALAQAKTLFPDLVVKDVIEKYLAEGIDIDPEGAYLERSIGVYDAVTNRSLLLLAQNWRFPEALEAVERNLNFNLHLLHADGSAETGLSRRQDYGTRQIPLGLAACYLLSDHVRPNLTFRQTAQALWEKQVSPRTDVDWLCYALLKCGDPDSNAALLPEDFARYFPLNGIHRVRRGLLNASFFRNTTRLLTLTYGQAELSSLKISQTYFGQYTGRFISDSLEVGPDHWVLRSEGQANPRRPGYELPLGQPVPPDRWQEMMPQRSLRRLPPALSALTVREIESGFELRYQTLAGLDRVAAQIALDFPPGGIWETGDTRAMPLAGQLFFLKQGYGQMRYGSDVIRLEPGAYAHGMWHMRDSEPAPNHVRILLTFLTPIDFTFRITAYRGLVREQN
jgi:hypothetical protein